MTGPLGDLQLIIDQHIAANPGGMRLLEAGCGSLSRLRLGENVEIVGIDISARQLERNVGLHERVLADIQTYALPERHFDVIVCWEVLEHLQHPEQALRNFFRAIKPGGLIVLAFPNLFSLKGILTKFTPHAFHVWYYKRLLHVPDAGENDTAPFETPFRFAATYPAIRRQTKAHRATVAFFALRESHDMRYVRDRFRFIDWGMKATSFLARAVSLGRIDPSHSDCILVLRGGEAG